MLRRALLPAITALAVFLWPALAAASSHETGLIVSPDRVEPGASAIVSGTCGSDAAGVEIDIVLGGRVEGGLIADDVPTDARSGDFVVTVDLPEGPTGTAAIFANCGLGSERDPSTDLTISAIAQPDTVVSRGDASELVTYWQDRLNDWFALSDVDFDAGDAIAVDGIFGPETEQATLTFQEKVDEVAPDAVVHPEDRAALHDAIDALESGNGGSDVVARGDTGRLVEFWQDRLNDWFALSDIDPDADDAIAVDGIFGPETEDATLTFQKTTDSVVDDGVVDPEDRVALRYAIDALESEDGVSDTVVARGDEGRLVAYWQDRLNDWLALSGAADPITVDGIFGPETEEATLVFQDTSDVVPSDAEVNPEDRVALREAIEALAEEDAAEPAPQPEPEPKPEVPRVDAARTANFPASGQPALLQSVLTRQVEGNDQILLDFDTGDDFSYEVDYVAAAIAPSGEEVEVAGDYNLLVTMTPATAVDRSGSETRQTYTGAERWEPRDLDAVAEIALVEDFEGTLTWVIGTTVASPFRVETSSDEVPLRLTITLTQE